MATHIQAEDLTARPPRFYVGPPHIKRLAVMGRHYALSFPQKLLGKSRQFPQHRGLPRRYGGKLRSFSVSLWKTRSAHAVPQGPRPRWGRVTRFAPEARGELGTGGLGPLPRDAGRKWIEGQD